MIALLLLPVLLGDIGWRNAGADAGPVRAVNCQADGGLYCTRNTTLQLGSIRCLSATASEPGCVTPSSQTFAGDKTFTGTVKAPVVDAGVVAVGTMDLRGNTIAGGSAATLLIQSTTADSVTTSTIGAITLKAGADIAATDPILSVQDSTGTDRLRVRENGYLSFIGTVTEVGAPGASGTYWMSTTGSGGAATGATTGKQGGQYLVTPGSGGAANGTAVGGNGGEFFVSTGAGGASSGTTIGGSGGYVKLEVANAGGGAVGGAVTLRAGNAGAATASHATDNGGAVSVTAGVGGAAASGDVTAGLGGAITITSGAGGTSVVGETSGAGGALTLSSGVGGATSGGTGASGGAVVLDTGAATGAATAGTISIGATNGGALALGRSGQTATVGGNLAVAGNSLSGTGTGSTFSITSATSEASATATVAAFTLAATTNLLTDDLLLEVNDFSGAPHLMLTEQGVLTLSDTTAVTPLDLKLSGGSTSQRFICSSAGTSCDLRSELTDATVSTITPAIALQAANDIQSDDLLLAVKTSTGTSALALEEDGDTALLGGLTIAGGMKITKHTSATASLDFNLSGAGITCQDLNIGVVSAADGDTVAVGIPAALASTAGVQFSWWVSAVDTVTVRACDVTSSNPDPAAATVRADVWKH